MKAMSHDLDLRHTVGFFNNRGSKEYVINGDQ